MEPITTFTGACVLLPLDNIDTDQIIPARFLKATDKQGMGDHLFADWRYDAAGNPRSDFVLNRPEASGAQILVAGDNFGCGSSREHAPWALQGYGFRAVVSTSFGDIFRNNAMKVGLLPIMLDTAAYRELVSALEAKPQTPATVDLATQTLRVPGHAPWSFPIDSFAKYCLLNGVDQLGFLLSQEEAIATYEAAQPARIAIK